MAYLPYNTPGDINAQLGLSAFRPLQYGPLTYPTATGPTQPSSQNVNPQTGQPWTEQEIMAKLSGGHTGLPWSLTAPFPRGLSMPPTTPGQATQAGQPLSLDQGELAGSPGSTTNSAYGGQFAGSPGMFGLMGPPGISDIYGGLKNDDPGRALSGLAGALVGLAPGFAGMVGPLGMVANLLGFTPSLDPHGAGGMGADKGAEKAGQDPSGPSLGTEPGLGIGDGSQGSGAGDKGADKGDPGGPGSGGDPGSDPGGDPGGSESEGEGFADGGPVQGGFDPQRLRQLIIAQMTPGAQAGGGLQQLRQLAELRHALLAASQQPANGQPPGGFPTAARPQRGRLLG